MLRSTSRVTHVNHHYRESIRRGAASPDVQDGASQSPGSIHRYENAARESKYPRHSSRRGVRDDRARRRAPPVRGRGARGRPAPPGRRAKRPRHMPELVENFDEAQK